MDLFNFVLCFLLLAGLFPHSTLFLMGARVAVKRRGNNNSNGIDSGGYCCWQSKKDELLQGLLQKIRGACPANKRSHFTFSRVAIKGWPAEVVIFDPDNMRAREIQLLWKAFPGITMTPKLSSGLRIFYPPKSLPQVRSETFASVVAVAKALGFTSDDDDSVIDWPKLARHAGVAGKLILSTGDYTKWTNGDLFSIQTMLLERVSVSCQSGNGSEVASISSSVKSAADEESFESAQRKAAVSADKNADFISSGAKKAMSSQDMRTEQLLDSQVEGTLSKSIGGSSAITSSSFTVASTAASTSSSKLSNVKSGYEKLNTVKKKRAFVLKELGKLFKQACPDYGVPGIGWTRVRISGMPEGACYTTHTNWPATIVDQIYAALPQIVMTPREPTAHHSMSHVTKSEAQAQMHKLLVHVASYLGLTSRKGLVLWGRFSSAVGGILIGNKHHTRWSHSDICELQQKVFGFLPKQPPTPKQPMPQQPSLSVDKTATPSKKSSTRARRSARKRPASFSDDDEAFQNCRRRLLRPLSSAVVVPEPSQGSVESQKPLLETQSFLAAAELDSFSLFDDDDPLWQ